MRSSRIGSPSRPENKRSPPALADRPRSRPQRYLSMPAGAPGREDKGQTSRSIETTLLPSCSLKSSWVQLRSVGRLRKIANSSSPGMLNTSADCVSTASGLTCSGRCRTSGFSGSASRPSLPSKLPFSSAGMLGVSVRRHDPALVRRELPLLGFQQFVSSDAGASTVRSRHGCTATIAAQWCALPNVRTSCATLPLVRSPTASEGRVDPCRRAIDERRIKRNCVRDGYADVERSRAECFRAQSSA